MTRLLQGVALGALAVGTATAANTNPTAGQKAALATATFQGRTLHLDALTGPLTPQTLHLDALQFTSSNLHLDALGFGGSNLHLDALNLHLDALSSNLDILNGDADAFWGTFEPDNLHLDALGLTPNNLHLDALNLHLDALAAFDGLNLHLDALNLHLDALSVFDASNLHLDALNLHLDALDSLTGAGLHLDALNLHLDALNLHLDALNLHLDALGGFDELNLHLDALNLHLDALAAFDGLNLHLDALNLHLDALSFDEMNLHLDALASLQELTLHLDALNLHLDALDMAELNLHLDALGIENFNLHLDALSGLSSLNLHLDALGQAAEMLSTAYASYTDLLVSVEDAYGALVTEETGLSFVDGFLAEFLNKHGLSGDGFGGYIGMTTGERNAFLLDLSDQLTTFMGIDHIDHWMPTIGWSPRLAELAGAGTAVTVGVVDQAFTQTSALGGTTQVFGPVYTDQNHGLAVSGTIGGAIDSDGVMGVAPNANIVVSNPFGIDGEAEINDVTHSIAAVGAAGASIINLSLGEAGFTFSEGWVDAFGDAAVQANTGNSLFVMAAGNDGVTQTTDVDFGSIDVVERIVLVGALGLDGELASFSNTPGSACFITNAQCTAMRDRFLVAPGEQILVATPEGVGRASGTSFAAPMVSGAAALLQSRWAWLANEPEATAEILFRTATDLGDAGVDDTYGWGLLNVDASQRPLEISALTFLSDTGSKNLVGSALSPELIARVDSLATLTVFEDIGSTYRDFEIPVGVLQAGAIDASVSLEQDVEAYFADRLGTAVGASQSMASLSFSHTQGFTDRGALGSLFIGSESSVWTLSIEAREPAHGLAVPAGGVAFESHGTLRSQENGMTVRFGQGDGALAFGSTSFAMTSDHDILTGGVNPLLGLASGGGYIHTSVPLTDRLTVSGGLSQRDHADLVINPFSGEIGERIAGSEGYQAGAAAFGLGYTLDDATSVTVSLTALRETDGLFGGQSLGALSFGESADSRAVTIQADRHFGRNTRVTVSGTFGHTRGGQDSDGLLGIDQGGIRTTAYQAILSKKGLIRKNDQLRLSVAQPLTVEGGSLEVNSIQVTDRNTGALGMQSDRIALNGLARRYVGEVLYGTPVLKGRGELALFGQVDSAPVMAPSSQALTGGLRFAIAF